MYHDTYDNIPVPKGNVSIFPSIYEANNVLVSIIGDKEGLLYLAELLKYMAEVNVEQQGMPEGERAHIPLQAGKHLIDHSSEVQICRAEAKGSGDYPDYFEI